MTRINQGEEERELSSKLVKKMLLPQLLVISQSDWLICSCLESRQRYSRHARVNLSRNVKANQKRSFYEKKPKPYCEKVIDNACSFLCPEKPEYLERIMLVMRTAYVFDHEIEFSEYLGQKKFLQPEKCLFDRT